MKIAVNTRILQSQSTGIQNFIMNVFQDLTKTDHKNEYVFFQTHSSSTFPNTITFRIPQSNLWNIFFDVVLVNWLIIKANVDIFHGPSHILPFFKIPGVKYVVTVHDLSFITFPQMSGRWFRLVYTILIKRSLAVADLVITDSESTRKDITRIFGTNPHKIVTVHLGVSSDFLVTSKRQPPVKEDYIFSVSTHPIRKNLVSTLAAFGESKYLKDYKFIIVGPDTAHQKEIIEKKTAEYGLEQRVVYLGNVDRATLISLYQHARLFVYPSFYEGFGLPVLEAMASKTLVVSSNTSSIPEILTNPRFLADPYSTKDIMIKMEKAIRIQQSDRMKIINENYNIAKSFSWNKCAQGYLKLYEKI